MRILQIGDNDLYGRRFNGHDLMHDLLRRGIPAEHLVWTKHSQDPNTFKIGAGYENRSAHNHLVAEIERYYGLHGCLMPFSHSLFYDEHFLEADVVHYHLVHNYFFNLNLFPPLTQLKPTVWTLHDPWALTGHCVHPCQCERWKTGCGDCPSLDSFFPLRFDSTALNWEMKKHAYEQTQVDIIVASPWMQRLVRQSPLMSGFKIHLIPFGTKLDRFCPAGAEEAKQSLGIPPRNLVLSFRVHKVFKGSDYVREALNRLKTNVPITLLTSGGDPAQMDDFKDRFQVVDLGWTLNDDLMVRMYKASDIFLMPSTGDSFGMMAMEAMACGKPVIVFQGTALPETIFAPEGGIAVPQGDVKALAREIEQLIADKEKRLKIGASARRLAEQHYNNENYVTKILDVYREVIAKRQIGDRSRYILNQLKKISQQSKPVNSEVPTNDADSPTVAAPPLPPIVDAEAGQLAELALLKSSVYFKVYDRLRKKRPLRFLSNTMIKPTIQISWKIVKGAKAFVRRSAAS